MLAHTKRFPLARYLAEKTVPLSWIGLFCSGARQASVSSYLHICVHISRMKTGARSLNADSAHNDHWGCQEGRKIRVILQLRAEM